MTKHKQKFDFSIVRRFWPYIVATVFVVGIAFYGSLDKHNQNVNLSLDTFAETSYRVSVDQLSAMYMVADVSDSLSLANAEDVASNFVITSSMYEVGQTSAGKLEKPPITNISFSRGVVEYIVREGQSMGDIAAEFGITTDQIRWSNKLKTTDISAGNVLYIPSVSGIVYTVKADDTIEGIVSKYGSTYEEIVTLNDLETSGISEGMRILIKGGELPEKERPEYVAPVVRTYATYTYQGSSYSRQNVEVLGSFYGLGGPYVAGQCTQWAWYKRQDLPSNLGNANSWAARAAAAGYRVDRTPAPGAVFQSSAGWYGHVGYVEAVNPDGSIVASEMNYNYRPFQVIRSTIPANVAASLNYIH